MTLTAPPAVGWSPAITGIDQLAVDPTPADQTYTVDDATGSAVGWHVTTSALAFTDGPDTLGTVAAGVPTFSTNGTLALTAGGAIDTTAPDANCLTGSTCTLPTNALAAAGYPVTITTDNQASPAAVTIYDAAAGTGLGTIVVGNNGVAGVNPVGWWINVPANTVQGTYTSTITMELIAGP